VLEGCGVTESTILAVVADIQQGQGMVHDEGSTAEHPLFKAAQTCSSANYGVASRAYGLEESPCIHCPEGMVTAHLFKSNITGQQSAVPADHQLACTAAQMLKQGAGISLTGATVLTCCHA
jgi:hypothetical protein